MQRPDALVYSLAVLLGIFPQMIFNWMEPHVTGLVQSLAQAAGR